MEAYRNSSGSSGVELYEIGVDYIIVKFKNSTYAYHYTYKKPGVHDVEEMKNLAKAGRGLNSYINQNVRNNFERRKKL
ncbi:hypothetical protein Lsan_1085 [Legionella santicrucis]|uniref:KTSC domain-containing protein n=1 Tax=Legionella santicrucis TaxID=45074 RepID=A0A0W0Z3F0_9GAMM|nr:hypothetical protein [Legionella santicrucis]KTD63652.1 hypothetical protein Lsan_1085 [Legionella santicrucis]